MTETRNQAQPNDEEEFQGVQSVINEKNKRCDDFKKGLDCNIPQAFVRNTPKEELILEHVIDFKKQFQYQLYYEEEAKRRRELFLYPENECGVYKFICTTIRGTKLGYLQLYDYHQCATYLAQYITYEELQPPDQFPSVIPSPSNVSRWQKGDCFDMSMLLCSLLIGVGYDAYVVYGKAPKDITTKNESMMEYQYKKKGKLEVPVIIEEDLSKGNDFICKKKEPVYSKYDDKVRNQKIQQEAEKQHKINSIDDDQPDFIKEDPYEGRRIHAWVLVKAGKRELERELFIEPSTGRLYSLKQSPYLVVDCVFNNYNFWINMDPERKVSDVNFNTLNEDLTWEYVMLDSQEKNKKDNEEDDNQDDGNYRMGNSQNDEEDKLEEVAQTLDMPPSWTPKVRIEKEKFIKGTLSGSNTLFFNRVKVDQYAQYSQPDGLVEKITLYEDYKKIRVKEYRYFYKHRSDKLSIRRRYPFEYKVVEDYLPSPYVEKKHMQWKQYIHETFRDERDGQLKQKNTIYYYHNRNHDSLVKRVEIIGEKTIEYYRARDDKLIYRSIRFTANKPTPDYKETFVDNHIKTAYILKISQKYEVDPLKDAHTQINKMVIDYTKKQSLTVVYHMEKGEITPQIKTIPLEGMQGIGKLTETTEKKEESVVNYENQKLQEAEKECNQQMKTSELTAKEDIDAMRNQPITLEKTIEQKAREKFKENQKKSNEEENKENEMDDYLYPYLAARDLVGKKEPIKRVVAEDIKKDVMDKLKQRMLARAEIITQRLLLKRKEIEEKEKEVSKNKDLTTNQERDISDLHFQIEILEQRALRFEQMALKKYEEMDTRIQKDSRMAELLTKK